MRVTTLGASLVLLCGGVLAPSSAGAQRQRDLVPVAAQRLRPDDAGGVAWTPLTSLRLDSARARTANGGRAARDSAVVKRKPPLLWPWFALGGAVVGAGVVVGYSVRHCDQGCRDDGAMAYVPYYAALFALKGAVVGGLVGGVLDIARRHPGHGSSARE